MSKDISPSLTYFLQYLLQLVWDGLWEEGWADEGHVSFVFLYWKALMFGKGLHFFGVSSQNRVR